MRRGTRSLRLVVAYEVCQEQHVCLNTTRHGKERAENHLERRQLVVSKLLKLIKLLQERVDESQ